MARLDEMRFDPSRLGKATAADYSSSESDAEDEEEYLVPSTNPHDSEFADHNPRKRRRTGRDAKESAALGIFGSESDDDDDGGPGARFKRKNLRNKGMSFVSSAANKATTRSDDDDDDDDLHMDDGDDDDDEYGENGPTIQSTAAAADDDDEEDEEDEEAGGVGLGFRGPAAASAAAQGLGWAPPTQRHMVGQTDSMSPSPKPSQPFVKSTFGASNPLGTGFMPTSAKVPTLLVRDDEPTTPRAAMPSTYGGQGKGGKTKINPKSFGARMMAKMGYVEGKGLGVEGQGRHVIIEANLRPQKVGLGAVKEKTVQEREEEKRQARLRGEVLVDSDEEEKKRKAARRRKALGGAGGGGSGPGSGASTPRRQKPKYVTMEEVKKAAPGLDIPDAFTPILDLTGPGKKMLTSSSGLMTPGGSIAADSAETVEARKLARRAQSDFMAILEEWQSLQERKAYVDLQLQQEGQELDELTTSLQGNQSIATTCEAISQPPESGEFEKKADLTFKLGRIISGLRDASNSLSDSMLPQIKDELAILAVAAIYPTLKEFIQLWKPLEEPKPGFVDGLVSIRHLLGLEAKQHSKKGHRRATATPYEVMMYKFWLPAVASSVRDWNVREPEQLIALFEAWEQLMPTFVRAQLLEQDIVRKLDEAIQKWQPKKKGSSASSHNLPHVWIFPWLPYLPATHLDPKSSTGLVADVKRKFRQLIDVWEFDRGLIPGLKQWKEILRPTRSHDQWGPLVMNHVLPSMARYLKTHFRVDPQDQEPYMGMLEGVFQWLDVIRPSMVGEVLVSEIFPMWHDALYHWLLLDEANFEEIGQWFEWWQNDVFPEDIKSIPSITAEFTKGTALVEQALDLGDRAKTDLKPPEKGPALQAAKPTRDSKLHRHHQQPVAQPVPAKQVEEVTFRHVMEEWCQQNDLQFIPERKKVHAEGPLYRITSRGDGKGGILVYFQGDVLIAEMKGKDPIKIRRDAESTWEFLLEMA
ncbi:GC-rich sequence DNA-binding factor-like protein-domain-containing protein [Podospora appendiculata]|uniref:GC-rich sequence DNA-binding factor-like protein-domain-containing protein n=1 Tax=Podospora appendiculata TaxID=314037 RepID=A0AAE0XAX0_9PEZI|nr:GC-rich sequence DNA-binding factor-like protein-domain-containing protein [Podospora appendiculata]